MYDLIGDIHGHAEALQALLKKLGYSLRDGVYAHADRQAIFVGDLIDRGPDNRKVVHIARTMMQAGHALAVMGNHEFNALAYATPDPQTPGRYLRAHSDKNQRQHHAFLSQFSGHPQERATCMEWLASLPLFLERPGLRVIHACWSQTLIDRISDRLGPGNTLTPELLIEGTHPGTTAYTVLEALLKGPEAELPAGASYRDKEGTRRHQVRVKWWIPPRQRSLAELVIGPPDAAAAAAGCPTPALSVDTYPTSACPVFFGHYWLSGKPAPQTANVACLDYSVAKGGKLVAYRWDGEQRLSAHKMVSV